MMRRSPRDRKFVFTMNNYTEEDEAMLTELLIKEEVLNLYIGREVAPSTGTKHLQGFVRFDNEKNEINSK
jgi:hypothetical protein